MHIQHLMIAQVWLRSSKHIGSIFFPFQSLCTPLGVSSKLTQIYALYKQKEPGRLSAATWSIAGYGCYGNNVLQN